MMRNGPDHEVRQRYAAAMPGKLGMLFPWLWDELAQLHGTWEVYVDLFGHSQERSDLLHATAPDVFGLVGLVLVRDVFLRISRFSDPAASGGPDRSNVSLAALAAELRTMGESELADRVDERIRTLRRPCATIREIRNRELAHADLGTVVGTHPQPIGEVGRRDVEEALALGRETLNLVEKHFAKSTSDYQGMYRNAVLPLIRACELARSHRS